MFWSTQAFYVTILADYFVKMGGSMAKMNPRYRPKWQRKLKRKMKAKRRHARRAKLYP